MTLLERDQKRSKNKRQIALHLILVGPFLLEICIAVGLAAWSSVCKGYKAVNNVAILLRSKVTACIQQSLQSCLATRHLMNQLNLDAIHLSPVKLRDSPSLQRYFWQQPQTFARLSNILFSCENIKFWVLWRISSCVYIAINYYKQVLSKKSPGGKLGTISMLAPSFGTQLSKFKVIAVTASQNLLICSFVQYSLISFEGLAETNNSKELKIKSGIIYKLLPQVTRLINNHIFTTLIIWIFQIFNFKRINPCINREMTLYSFKLSY